MIILRNSIGICAGYRSQFVAHGCIITMRCKSVKAPVSKKSTVVKPSISKKAQPKKVSAARASGPAKETSQASANARKSVEKDALKPDTASKSSKQPSKSSKTKSVKSGTTVLPKKGSVGKAKLLSTISSAIAKSKLSKTAKSKPDKLGSPSNAKVLEEIEGGSNPPLMPSPNPPLILQPTPVKMDSKDSSGEKSETKSKSNVVTGKLLKPSKQPSPNPAEISQLSKNTENASTEMATARPQAMNNQVKKKSSSKTTSKTTVTVTPLTPANWSTFLYDIFGTTSNKKVVDLVQPSKYESRVDEYSYETKRRKKALEMIRNKPNVRGFKFLNYDTLTKLQVGNFEFNKDDEPNELKVCVNKQHLVLANDAVVPAITIKQPECLTFRNPTGLASLEQVGGLLIFEYLVKWALMNNCSPHKLWKGFIESCKYLQFIQLDVSATILFRGLQPLNVFVAMVYLEDKDYYYAIMKFLKKLAASHKLDTNFTTESLIAKYVPTINTYLELFPAPIEFEIFSQVFRPVLLHSLPIKLPALPKLINQELYKLAQVSLLPSSVSAFAQYPEVVFLRDKLDSLGDAILKRYSVEYMVHYSKINPKFGWNMDDVVFINTNIVFSRLCMAYKLHHGIKDKKIQDQMNHIITSSGLNTANELLGDMFERMVAIEYLSDADLCRKWVFQIYDVILANLTKEKDGLEFIDKEKFIKLYEYQLKTKIMY